MKALTKYYVHVLPSMLLRVVRVHGKRSGSHTGPVWTQSSPLSPSDYTSQNKVSLEFDPNQEPVWQMTSLVAQMYNEGSLCKCLFWTVLPTPRAGLTDQHTDVCHFPLESTSTAHPPQPKLATWSGAKLQSLASLRGWCSSPTAGI